MKTETLLVQLTDDERDKVAEELSAGVDMLVKLKADNRARRKSMKEAEDKLDIEIQRLAEVHRTGKESRAVEVVERTDPDRAVRETIRMDTGEVIRRRVLTEQELFEARQPKIPGVN